MSLAEFLPLELRDLADLQTDLPRIAKDRKLTALVESAVRDIPNRHDLRRGDARAFEVAAQSVQLVLTSPPYWTLKDYRDSEGQLGHVEDYEAFLGELDCDIERLSLTVRKCVLRVDSIHDLVC